MTKTYSFPVIGAVFGLLLAFVLKSETSLVDYLIFSGVGAVIGFASIRVSGGLK